MRRKDREQDLNFSLTLIDRCTHGVLALSTGELTPYCLPLSFVRVGEELYFHCAREGRKIDLLRRFPQVCITFVGDDQPAFIAPTMYTTYFQSVIVTGTAVEVENPREKTDVLRALCQKMTPEYMNNFNAAVEKSLTVTSVWKIHMEHISSKAKLKP